MCKSVMWEVMLWECRGELKIRLFLCERGEKGMELKRKILKMI